MVETSKKVDNFVDDYIDIARSAKVLTGRGYVIVSTPKHTTVGLYFEKGVSLPMMYSMVSELSLALLSAFEKTTFPITLELNPKRKMDELFENFEQEFPDEYRRGIAKGVGKHSALSTVETSEVFSQYSNSRVPRLSQAMIVNISSRLVEDIPVETENKPKGITEKLKLIIKGGTQREVI